MISAPGCRGYSGPSTSRFASNLHHPDVIAVANAASSGSKYKEPAFIEESEATNLNDGDYVKEEEEGSGDGMLTDDYIDMNTVKVAAKAGEKCKQD